MPNQKTRARRRRHQAQKEKMNSSPNERWDQFSVSGLGSSSGGMLVGKGHAETTQIPRWRRYKGKRSHFRLLDLPRDIIFLIFDLLLPRKADTYPYDQAISLGLTCSTMYLVLKTFYPQPILLSTEVFKTFPSSCRYHPRLADVVFGTAFLPRSEYRPSVVQGFDRPLYLSIRVYGKQVIRNYGNSIGWCHNWWSMGEKATQPEEIALLARYEDFDNFGWNLEPCTRERIHGVPMPVLPSPHNMGRAWYQAVKVIYDRDVGRDFAGWSLTNYRTWKQAWKQLHAYKKLRKWGQIKEPPRRLPG